MSQTNLFDNLRQPYYGGYLELGQIQTSVFSEKIIETRTWKEYHKNGQLWIDGEIALIKEEYKSEFNFRTGFPNYEGQPVVRVGVWTKYFDNGQLAWQLDFGDGMYESKVKRQNFPSFRKDGTPIITYW